MKKLLIATGLLLSQLSHAAYLDCKVESYELKDGQAKYSVLDDVGKVYLFERIGNTTEERISGCDYRDENREFVQVKVVKKSGSIQEITRCENLFGSESLLTSSINIKTLNDHDAPEEIISLKRIDDNTVQGTITSSWDAKETLNLTCKLID